MTTQERVDLATAKAQHKASKKNQLVYNETRNNLIRAFLGAALPNWSGVKFTVTKLGI